MTGEALDFRWKLFEKPSADEVFLLLFFAVIFLVDLLIFFVAYNRS